jgi:hypothetical protein
VIFVKHARIRLVQELILSSLLSKSQAHHFVATFNNRQENLIIALSLSGQDAHFFGKDLQLKISNWQFTSAQELHLALLDLNKECRLKKLQLNFAITLKTNKQLILSCQGGSILLKRQNQIKQLLHSQAEILMLIGQYLAEDQLILIAGNLKLGQVILEKSRNQNLKNVIEHQLIDYLKNNFNTALVLWNYQKKEKLILKNKITNLKNYLKKIKKLFKKIPFCWKKIRNLRQEQKKQYKKLFIIIFFVSISIAGVLLIRRYQQKQKIEQIDKEISALVLSEKELEILGSTQPVLAREKIDQSLQDLNQLLANNRSFAVKKILEQEINKLNLQSEKLASENNLDRLSIYSNWYDEYPDFLGTKLVVSEQGLLLANDQQNQLLLITANNDFEIWNIDYQNFAIDPSNNEQLTIFIKNKGIQYLDWQNKTITELKTEGDTDRDGLLLESYQNYLYLLNPEKRNIYRYTLKDKELSEAIGWMVEKQGINFSNISDMSIDGNLWLSFKDGNIVKFDRGYQEEFVLTGLNQAPKDTLLMASRENSDKLVFLDKTNKRLIITTKEGQLINEIKSNELAGVSDISLAIDGQSCFALSGSVIYQIQL